MCFDHSHLFPNVFSDSCPLYFLFSLCPIYFPQVQFLLLIYPWFAVFHWSMVTWGRDFMPSFPFRSGIRSGLSLHRPYACYHNYWDMFSCPVVPRGPSSLAFIYCPRFLLSFPASTTFPKLWEERLWYRCFIYGKVI